jgi:hypothetical protein
VRHRTAKIEEISYRFSPGAQFPCPAGLLNLLIFQAYRRVPCGKPPIHVQSIAWIALP